MAFGAVEFAKSFGRTLVDLLLKVVVLLVKDAIVICFYSCSGHAVAVHN